MACLGIKGFKNAQKTPARARETPPPSTYPLSIKIDPKRPVLPPPAASTRWE